MKEGNKSNTLIIHPCFSLFLKCYTEKRNHTDLNVLLLSQGNHIQLLKGELKRPFSESLEFHLEQMLKRV